MRRRTVSILLATLLVASLAASFTHAADEKAWSLVAPHCKPPQEYAGDFGTYRSPLERDDGTRVATAAEWPARRAEIEAKWWKLMGGKPKLIEKPKVEYLDKTRRENFTQQHVHVEVGPDGRMADGYLLTPDGPGPFPAVFIPFYEPQSSIGLGKPDTLGAIDFGVQLTRRGFVTLSIATPGTLEEPAADVRKLLVDIGDKLKLQPLGYLASVASNCHTALAQLPNVDPKRIGGVGHSYGGKWTMFGSCLDERFACAVWVDPGIVFDETNGSVNYWEPWYLGWDGGPQRPRGIPTPEKPRTGLYKTLYENNSREMLELHALMAGRPMLDSGGSEDPPRNWRALNHLIAVNKLLGKENMAAMTNRPMHRPTPEAAAVIYAFFEHHLKK